MASNSGWTTNLPSGTSKVSSTDDEFRSLKSFVEAWLEEEHYVTDGSANSAGVHKHGSARAYVGTSSQLSNPTGDNDGRLFWTTDTQALYVAQGSSSSWSVVADNIMLSSEQTWTATQEFSDIVVTNVFSGITSITTTLAAAVGVPAVGDSLGASFNMLNPGSTLSSNDFFIVSKIDTAPSVLADASVNSSTQSIVVNLLNRGSRSTLPSGSVVKVLAFTV